MYCGSISMRTRGLPLSKAQITPSGWKVSTILMNMLKKPKRALVARPSGAFMGWRIAWNARCMSEFPSMTAMVRGASGMRTSLWLPSIVGEKDRRGGAGREFFSP